MVRAIVTLRKRSDFLRIQNSEVKVAAKGLVLCAIPCSESSHVRVGFTVTKTVGNAVERNRVRRRLRALVREILPRFSSSPADYVLIGRKAALTRDYEGLEKDLKYALHTIHKAADKAA